MEEFNGFPVLSVATLGQALNWALHGLPPLADRHEGIEGRTMPDYNFLETFHPSGESWREDRNPRYSFVVECAARNIIRLLAQGRIASRGLPVDLRGPWDPMLGFDHPDAIDISPDLWDFYKLSWLNSALVTEQETYHEIRLPFAQIKDLIPPGTWPESDGTFAPGRSQEGAMIEPHTDHRAADLECAPKDAPPLPEVISPKGRRGAPSKVEREVWLERLAVLALAGKIDKDTSQEAVAEILVDDLRRRGLDNGLKATTLRRDERGPCSLLRGAKELAAGK